jgi:hypothetical protein
MSDAWKRCSSCKKDIAFGATYYVCSVSTCTRKRTGMTFCSVECWETHLPMMRHREAGAVEEQAPTRAQYAAEVAAESSEGTSPAAGSSARSEAPRRRVVAPPGAPAASTGGAPREVLVVASRFKSYVKQRFGMNTSDGVFDVISDHLRSICHQAEDNARADGRKTLLERDFDFLRRR